MLHRRWRSERPRLDVSRDSVSEGRFHSPQTSSARCLVSPCVGTPFLSHSPSSSGFFPESLKVQRERQTDTVLLPAPGKRRLCPFSLSLAISVFCISICLSQLRVLRGNPASYPKAHPLPHGLGLPRQPGRLHAAEASWPSPPAPAEPQRHVMPSGCPPARFPPLPRGPR